MRVDASIPDKQSRTSDKGCSSSLEVGRGPNNTSPLKVNDITLTFHKVSDLDKDRVR